MPHHGLVTLYEPDGCDVDTENGVDIVAVHGIGADPDRTWRKGDRNWLSDHDMLPGALPCARILRFGYPSQWLGSEAIQQRLPLVADQLLCCLRESRQKCPTRPILFIGHCFGGLVIQKAILSSTTHSNDYGELFNLIRGVIFLGTPNRGTSSQSKAAILATVAAAAGYGEHSSLLRAVEKDSESLKDLLHEFCRVINVKSIPLVCFFEQRPSNIAKAVTPKSMWWLFHTEIVVDETSGCIDGHPKLGLAVDHFNMNKFSGPDDSNYRLVQAEITRLIETAPAHTRSHVRATLDEATLASLNRRNEECLAALFLTDPGEDMNMIETRTDKLLSDSNVWVFSHTSYKAWLSAESNSVLWLHGDPGKGKTFIALSTVRNLDDHTQLKPSQPKGLIYFFCDYKDTRRNGSIAILRGLLYQIFSKRPDLCYVLRQEHEKRKEHMFSSSSSLHTLWNLLMSAAHLIGSVDLYIIIDALDECEQESTAQLLSLITSSVDLEDATSDGVEAKSNCRIKWLLTSRNEDHIRQELYDSTEIDLEQNAHEVAQSVSYFVASRVAHLSKTKRYTDSLAEEVQTVLRERAKGTFLWVALACRELAKPKVRSFNTKNVLERLPTGLTPLYDRITEQVLAIEEELADQIKAMLRAMAFAFRPLTVGEIAVVASLPIDGPDEHQTVLDYLELCSSLVTVKDEVVSFVHESARAYLHGRADLLPQDPSLGHAALAAACFDHICMDTSQSSSPLSDIPDNVPRHKASLLDYPVVFWLDHTLLALQNIQQHIEIGCAFLEHKSRTRQRWLDHYWPSKHQRWEQQPTEFEAIHLAAYAGLSWLVEAIMQVHGEEQVMLQDGLGNDALIWAAVKGRADTTTYLLRASADVTARNNEGLTALYQAATYGHRAVVEALVTAGADVDCCNSLGSTLLHCVTGQDHLEILRFLLRFNAKVDARDHLKWTAVQRACSNGQLEAVKIFQKHGADMSQKDREGMTLLHYAASQGHTDVASFLLKSGARINAKCYEQWTALHEATWSGEEATVSFLLKSGADVSQRTKDGYTALHHASWNGHLACVELLLRYGASPRARCHASETALHQAAWRGHDDVAHILTDAGSPLDIKNSEGKTALDHAKSNASWVVANLLEARAVSFLQIADTTGASDEPEHTAELPTKPLAFAEVHRNDEDPPVTLDPGIENAIPSEPVHVECYHHGHAGFSVPLKLQASYLDGTTRYYFCKTYGNEPMFRSEHLSLQLLSDLMPTFCPKPIVHGAMQDTGHYFLLTQFLETEPSYERAGSGLSLAQKLAQLHDRPVPMPEGYDQPMFGFPMNTFCGSTLQDNTFTHSWCYFFGHRRLKVIGQICEERHGADEELRMWLDRTIDHVAPALLREGHLGGRTGIKPSLVHGDLWMGNRAKGQIEGWDGTEEVCFDPSSCFAHNEYEFAIMRLFGGFLAGFWSQYHEIKPKTEPAEEYEDRISLYSVYHILNHYAIHAGGWKDDAISVMKDLWMTHGSKSIPIDLT